MPEDKKLTEVERLFAQLRMARKKRKEQHDYEVERNKKLYAGMNPRQRHEVNSGRNDSADKDKELNINMVHPNIETQKWATFIRNPKIYLSATKNKFKIPTGNSQQPFEEIDGAASASVTQFVVNHNNRITDIEEQVSKIRDDLLFGKYGVIYFGYNTDFITDEQGNEHINKEQIFVLRWNPKHILIDPEATDMEEFTDAKWIGREFFMKKADGLALFDIKEEELTNNNLVGFSELVSGPDDQQLSLIDAASPDYRKDEDAKRLHFIQMWIPPSIAEIEKAKKAKKSKPKGKVILLLEGLQRKVYDKPWPYKKMEGYPFLGTVFNRIPDEQYGPSDVVIYEEQLEEKNRIRSYQRDFVYAYGHPLLVIDADVKNAGEFEKKVSDARSGEGIVSHSFGLEPGDSINNHIYTQQLGSLPSETFGLNALIDNDRDQESTMSDVRRGQEAPRRKTATQSTLEFRAGGNKFNLRLYKMATLYKRYTKKQIQLMREFTPLDEIANIAGVTEITSAWASSFSKEYIQEEADIQVDISTMSEVNEAVLRHQAQQNLSMAVQAATNPAFKLELAKGGRKIDLIEVIDEWMKAFNIVNRDLIPKIGPKEQAQIIAETVNVMATMQRVTGPMGGAGGGAGGQPAGGGAPPSVANINAQANNPAAPGGTPMP